MIDVKQAIAKAKSYASEVLGQTDLLLEEVNSHPDRFEITLSFPHRRVREPLNPLTIAGRLAREYKSFNVDKNSGEVVGMMIREIV